MRSITYLFSGIVVAGWFTIAGCQSAPKTFADAVNVATREAQTRDAHLDYVADYPGLRVDDALRQRLDAALSADDLSQAQSISLDFFDRAHTLALRVTRTEIARLSHTQRDALRQQYVTDEPEPPIDLTQIFEEQTNLNVQRQREAVLAAQTVDDLRALLNPIRDGFETPVKYQGRFKRMAPWFIFTIASKIAINRIYAKEYRNNADVPFAAATVYHPAEKIASADVWPDEKYAALLARFAPIIVQEQTRPEATYASTIDRLGYVTTPTLDSVKIQTDKAVTYAYAREIYIQGHPHIQLTYTHWYSEHPTLKPNDPEAGHVDGVTFRITLDRHAKPAFFETLYNCGCYHHLYPTDKIEAEAVAAFGTPMPGKKLAIERHVKGKKDIIVPNAIATTDLPDLPDLSDLSNFPDAPTRAGEVRPVIRIRAGWHGIVDVGYVIDKYSNETHETVQYTLVPYELLEHTRTPDDQITSMFYDNGLVKQTQRKEGIYFTPAGILSAGQPRQRGTQLIVWDNWNFDDPHLFENTLRLPSDF